MSAGYLNLIIESGATFSTTMNIDDDTGANFNLTGYTAACNIH
jgi:hypothetical protein